MTKNASTEEQRILFIPSPLRHCVYSLVSLIRSGLLKPNSDRGIIFGIVNSEFEPLWLPNGTPLESFDGA